MSLIEWKDEFSVGNEAVDQEHRELIDLINTVHKGLCAGAESQTIVDGLGEIYAGIAAHFALEERIMRESRYDAYDSHKEDHEALLDQLSDIIDAVELAGSYDEASLSSTLDRWFSEHFRTHDARLHHKL